MKMSYLVVLSEKEGEEREREKRNEAKNKTQNVILCAVMRMPVIASNYLQIKSRGNESK